jgi:putative ABC transport system permease protein
MFKIYRILFEALKALWSAKLRTFLSAVCIGIGIAAVTLVTAIGAAAISKTSEMTDMFGTDSVFLFSGGSKRTVGRRSMTITVDDVNALRTNFPDAYFVGGMRSVWGLLVSYDNAKLSSQVSAVSTSFEKEQNWKVDQGRDLNTDDNEYSNNVCVIGSHIKETLFVGADSLGKFIKVGKSMCQVIGVAEKKSMGAYDDEMNTFIVFPETVFVKKYAWRKNLLLGARMRFTDPMDVDRQIDNVVQFLRHRHNLNDDMENDFVYMTPSTISKIIFKVLGAIGAFLGIITLIVIVVGGFVTANIFLLATRSRIKEIGIRRAFGATGKDIFNQFILEFIMISLCGMLLGLAAGAVGGIFVSSFGFLTVKITPMVFSVTATVSLIIALTFGILPARSASRINPIEAIRSL